MQGDPVMTITSDVVQVGDVKVVVKDVGKGPMVFDKSAVDARDQKHVMANDHGYTIYFMGTQFQFQNNVIFLNCFICIFNC